MTDNEIIKALEQLAKSDMGGVWIIDKSLDLISRQKEEIEIRDVRNNTLKTISKYYRKKIERLQEENRELRKICDRALKTYKETKSEARKEFAERLKSKKCAKGSRVIYIDRIVETLKEMEGE